MPGKFNPKTVNFSLDLITAALNQLEFLKDVNNNPQLENPDVLRQAIHRYEAYWLPLAAEHRGECLAAPLDIEWAWHCHLLCPTAYAQDCTTLFGTIPDHKLHGNYDKAVIRSRELWSRKYQKVNEPFEVDLNNPRQTSSGIKSRLSYDIFDAALRQKVFYYQVSLPHYKDNTFLENGLLRYKKFLFLNQQNPEAFIVPCFDIDLIWHSHQLYPSLYKKDTERILGRLFNHDDTVIDRSPRSKRSIADLATRGLWKRTFNEPFSMYGAMYRGNPPNGKLFEVQEQQRWTLATKQTDVTIECISLQFSRQIEHQKVQLILSCSAKGKNDKEVLKVQAKTNTTSSGILVWTKEQIGRGGSFIFDNRHHSNLKLELHGRSGSACCGSKETIGTLVHNFLSAMENNPGGCFVPVCGTLGPTATVELTGRMAVPRIGSALFNLEAGKYESAIIPERIEQLWGPIPLSHLPPGTDNKCIVASHRLKNHTGKVTFTCRILHSLPLMMSAIQVYFHDKMVVVGHLIGADQLPSPTSVEKGGYSVTLNPRAGERAVLIKNNYGDWGIVLGRWSGFNRGVPAVPGTRRQKSKKVVPGSPGTLTIKFYKMSTGRWTELSLGYLLNNYTFQIELSRVDLKTGMTEIGTTSNEVAENLALTFAVSLLHVLCVPRPSGWKEGQQVQPSTTSRGSESVTTIPSDDMAFIMACGLLWNTPSNFYIHHTYGGGGDFGVGDFSNDTGNLCAGDYGGESWGDGDYGGDCGDGGGDAGGCGGGCGCGGGGGCGGDGGGGGGGGCGGGCGGGDGCGGGGGGGDGGGGGGCGGGGGGCGGGGGGCGGGGGGGGGGGCGGGGG